MPPSSLKPPAASDDESLILDSVDRFLEKHVEPVAHDLEASDTWPAEIVREMADLGLFGATIGAQYGGLGLSASTYSKIVERVSAVWMSVSGIFNSHLIMAAAVERFGTQEQKRTWLPRFATGELRVTEQAPLAEVQEATRKAVETLRYLDAEATLSGDRIVQ